MKADPHGVLTGTHFIDGDHACCEGALAAGARFAAGYPITPSTEVVERFASRVPTVGGCFIQMEDELAASIAFGFKKTCPESFTVKDFGEAKLGDRDAYMAVASCGEVNSSGHSETALIVAVQGAADAYTIQWAERTAPAAASPAIDEARWRERLAELMPIRLCAIVPGEAAPYPSCLQQK